MKKNLYTSICAFLIILPFFAHAQSNLSKSKERQSTSSNSNAIKTPPAKPVSFKQSSQPVTAPNTQKHTPIVQQSNPSPRVPQQTGDVPTKLETRPIQPSNGSSSPVESTKMSDNKVEPAHTKSNALSAPAEGINKEALHWNAYLKFRYQNYRDAQNENRHCGCGADIQLVNPSTDTIDVFLKYVSSNSLPTIEETAMPEIRRDFLYPTFVVLPGETLTIRGSCNGGILYEATTHFPKTKGRKNNNKILIDPKFIDHGFIRNNCIDKRIVFENEKPE